MLKEIVSYIGQLMSCILCRFEAQSNVNLVRPPAWVSHQFPIALRLKKKEMVRATPGPRLHGKQTACAPRVLQMYPRRSTVSFGDYLLPSVEAPVLCAQQYNVTERLEKLAYAVPELNSSLEVDSCLAVALEKVWESFHLRVLPN